MSHETHPEGFDPLDPGPADPVGQLATRYLADVAEGGTPDLDALAATLDSDAERERLHELVQSAASIQDLLPAHARPGMLLSQRYRIGREIGKGGMGKVFEAFDTRLERRVAVKVLSLQGASSFDAHKQFRREAVLLANLKHANIVSLHEIATDDELNYIVMDLVEGSALDEVLEQARASTEADAEALREGGLLGRVLGSAPEDAAEGPASEACWHRAIARVVAEAARTVEAAHAAGLVHRDIKPKNVMLRRDGTPVLLDFGLAGACDTSGADVTQGLFGTMSYLAPEQVRTGQVGNDPRSDVYQLGCLLYEMLTRTRAFDGSSSTDLLRRIEHGDCRRPRELDPEVPFELQAICLRAMETDPTTRYQTARALREDLERWLGGRELPLAARGGRLSLVLRASRYALRRNAVAAAACAALLLGALIGGLAWVGSPPADALDVQAFRFRGGDGTVPAEAVLGPAIGSVSPGDRLGVVIETAEPLYVYVLSVFGQADPPTWIAPMWTLPVDARQPSSAAAADGMVGDEQAGIERVGWAVRVPAGRTRLLCTEIGAYDEDTPYEGLLIYTSREAQPRLSDWLAALDVSARGRGAVALSDARRLFQTGGPPTRGGTPTPLDPAQARALDDSLTAAILLGETEWPLDDPQRWTAIWPVTP